MALQIANPAVVAKIEKLAKALNMNKTAAVENAVDAMLKQSGNGAQQEEVWAQFHAIVERLHQLPDREDAIDPLQWDEHGLPI